MKYLKAEAADVVVVQNQYITQEFSALFDEKSFFLSDNPKTTRSLLAKLKLAGVREVIYISSAQEEPAMPNQLTPQRSGLRQVGSYFFAKYLLGP
jgi:nucleoside-diphosphate-sugar epimerase